MIMNPDETRSDDEAVILDTDNTEAPETLNRERLLHVLQSLEEHIKKQTSLRFAFLRGAVYGLGTVIGATLLLALFGGILATAISSLGGLPLIGEYIDQQAVDRYLEENKEE